MRWRLVAASVAEWAPSTTTLRPVVHDVLGTGSDGRGRSVRGAKIIEDFADGAEAWSCEERRTHSRLSILAANGLTLSRANPHATVYRA